MGADSKVKDAFRVVGRAIKQACGFPTTSMVRAEDLDPALMVVSEALDAPTKQTKAHASGPTHKDLAQLSQRCEALERELAKMISRVDEIHSAAKAMAEHEARHTPIMLVMVNQAVLIPDHDYTWQGERLKLAFKLEPDDIVRVVKIDSGNVSYVGPKGIA